MAPATSMSGGYTDGRDIVLNEVPAEAVGVGIIQCLSKKAFCTIATGLDEGVLQKSLGDVKDLDNANRFRNLHPLVLDGLLGRKGSRRVAELETPDLDEAVRSDGETLRALDDTISDMALLLEPYLPRIGLDASHRSLALVHENGFESTPDNSSSLSEKEVDKWLTQFVRFKVMVIIFLGPAEGSLELWPHHRDDAAPVKVTTTPGTMLLLRPDILGRRHSSSGHSVAISSFLLHGGSTRQRGSYTDLVPEAKALDGWMVSRLEELKKAETERSIWDESIVPREWQRAMNHLFHKGQMIGIHGAACRFPSADDPETFFKASLSGPDFVVEVPHTRWDHSEVYDPDPESWRSYKSYCKHAAFMDGVDLFDAKMFSISPSEAKSMDPNQRMILEVGYSAMYSAGLRKKTLLNSQCGVYVGNGVCEWNFVPRPADYGAFGATGGALSISAGRFSYILGLKGPCMTLDTEAASGLTATYMAIESVQKKGRAQPMEFSVAMGVHLCLAALWWPSHCASGWLCREGRCFTFDAAAAGYVRGEGCGAIVVKPMAEVVNGEVVSRVDHDTLVGCIGGAMMNTNGRSASLAAPSGAAEQEAICEAIRSAHLSPLDVDAVEVHGSGALLADAVEVGSMLRAHGREAYADPLCLLATKTSVGNQVECSGITGLLKSLFSAKSCTMAPNLHLKVCNPHIEAFEQPAVLVSEPLQHRGVSAFTGVMARGFGGSNVYVLTWNESDGDRAVSSTAPPLPNSNQHSRPALASLKFWPGGGGALAPELQPKLGYSIIGTWNRWSEAVPLENEGGGVFGYTMTMGENRWERFRIRLDGDGDRMLHPGRPKASKDAPVLGPDSEAVSSGNDWLIDGRAELLVLMPQEEVDGSTSANAGEAQTHQVQLVNMPTVDASQPGDQFRVRLQVNGCWRTVDWERLTLVETRPQTECGRYYLSASWDAWALKEMTRSDTSSGCREFVLQVGPSGHNGGEFKIIRDEDVGQVFYPAAASQSRVAVQENTEVSALGPDDESNGRCWRLGAAPGSTFKISLLIDDSGPRKVVWRSV